MLLSYGHEGVLGSRAWDPGVQCNVRSGLSVVLLASRKDSDWRLM